MKFTFSWLKDHINLDENPSQVNSLLTSLGLEVENFKPLYPSLMDMLVCKVIKINKHPNADKLKVCEVSSGKKNFTVVCGAGNLYENMKTVFAPNGTFIPGTKLNLVKKDIRGISGDGMLCSEKELCISNNSSGIIDLDETYELGKKFGIYIESDFIYEVGLTPNRGDCASVKGVARELAAKLNKKMSFKNNINHKSHFVSNIKWDLSSLENKTDCPLIIGREFKIQKNSFSPFYVSNRLLQVGVSPNSALVDVTNYLLYDLGRPLHVFDLDKITGNLKIRRAKNNEVFEGLDKKTYFLTKEDLVVADEKKVVSLAGIMGSSNSCVDANTRRVFLEVAYFDPILITETGKRHNIISDARYRFERGIDKEGLNEGLQVATKMITDFCEGEFSNEVISGKYLKNNSQINYSVETFEKITGYFLSTEMQIDYLKRLGFKVQKVKNHYNVIVPSWRHDISDSSDLVEEIARLEGYDKIPYIDLSENQKLFRTTIPDIANIEIDLRNKLANLGLYETKSYTFISPKKVIPESELKEELKIINPISNELSVMRNSLYPNLLDITNKNYSKGNDSISIFEIGYVFRGLDYNDQIKQLGIVLSGNYNSKNWHYKQRKFDFFDIKEIILQILHDKFASLCIDFQRSDCEFYHPGKSADIIYKKKIIGSYGELHPKLMKQFQLKQQTVLGNLALDFLAKHLSAKHEFKQLKISDFLPLKKDFSFVLPKSSKVSDLVAAIKNSNKSIGKILVFDIYEYTDSNSNGLSIGVEVEIIQEEKVLDSFEINKIMQDVILNVKKEINAELRV